MVGWLNTYDTHKQLPANTSLNYLIPIESPNKRAILHAISSRVSKAPYLSVLWIIFNISKSSKLCSFTKIFHHLRLLLVFQILNDLTHKINGMSKFSEPFVSWTFVHWYLVVPCFSTSATICLQKWRAKTDLVPDLCTLIAGFIILACNKLNLYCRTFS